MTSSEVLQELEKDIIFYDQSGGGVTFSGGEPLLQHAFLKDILSKCRERSIHTALDTSGYASWDALDDIRELVDLFLYDVKLLDGAKHRKYTGVPNKLILKNLQRLSEHRQRVIVRIPVIPGINDDAENLQDTAKFLAGLASLERVDLLPYHKIGLGKYAGMQRDYMLSDTQPPSEEKMAEIAGNFTRFGLPVKVGA
jgi:pyruvate formate lyase activating enzyme